MIFSNAIRNNYLKNLNLVINIMPNEVFIYYPSEENGEIQHFQMIQPEEDEVQPLTPEPINPEMNPDSNIQYHNSILINIVNYIIV